jgi:hypothetical protein
MQTEAPGLVHHLPVATTAVAAAFAMNLLQRGGRRGWPPHVAWWAAGILCYGAGTALESAVTLAGNTGELTRWWYLAGAILGGYPLATGSVYLLCRRPVAHALTAVSATVVLALAVAVLLSPLHEHRVQPHRPSGDVLGWTWIRACTPLVNGYAAVFLIGGAFWSAWRFWRPRAGEAPDGTRALATSAIAIGGLLPGVGGAMAKGGLVEALYLGEFAGLLLILAGHNTCARSSRCLTRGR